MLAATVVANVILIQIIPNLRHGRAFVVHLERIQHKGCLNGVDLEVLLAVN